MTDAHERLTQVAPRLMATVGQAAGDAAEGKMTLVFDRGGCSVPLFEQIRPHAHFITYVDDSDELGFDYDLMAWQDVTLRFKKKSRLYRICDLGGSYRGHREVRFVGVWNLKTGKKPSWSPATMTARPRPSPTSCWGAGVRRTSSKP